MPSDTLLTSLRASLEEEQVHLRRQLNDLALEEGESSLGFDNNFADSGQVAAEQGEQRALANNIEEALRDVERALEKMDRGTYGRCEDCGQEIGEARLQAMPAARFCIDCASTR